MGWLKIQKLEHLENGTKIFYEIKKSLTCASDDNFLTSYCFVAEVTFKTIVLEKAFILSPTGDFQNSLHHLYKKPHNYILRQ